MATSLDSRRFYERYCTRSGSGEEANLLNLTPEELQELTQNLEATGHDPSEAEEAYRDESALHLLNSCTSFF